MQKNDRRNNLYSSGYAERNAKNIEVLAAGAAKGSEKLLCEVRIMPTDIFGNILTQAIVTINEEFGSVEDCKNIAYVEEFTEVTYSVKLEGYGEVSGSIPFITQNEQVNVVMQYASEGGDEPEPVEPVAPVATPSSVSLVKERTAQSVTFDKEIKTFAPKKTVEWCHVSGSGKSWQVLADNNETAERSCVLVATDNDSLTVEVNVSQAGIE